MRWLNARSKSRVVRIETSEKFESKSQVEPSLNFRSLLSTLGNLAESCSFVSNGSWAFPDITDYFASIKLYGISSKALSKSILVPILRFILALKKLVSAVRTFVRFFACPIF